MCRIVIINLKKMNVSEDYLRTNFRYIILGMRTMYPNNKTIVNYTINDLIDVFRKNSLDVDVEDAKEFAIEYTNLGKLRSYVDDKDPNVILANLKLHPTFIEKKIKLVNDNATIDADKRVPALVLEILDIINNKMGLTTHRMKMRLLKRLAIIPAIIPAISASTRKRHIRAPTEKALSSLTTFMDRNKDEIEKGLHINPKGLTVADIIRKVYAKELSIAEALMYLRSLVYDARTEITVDLKKLSPHYAAIWSAMRFDIGGKFKNREIKSAYDLQNLALVELKWTVKRAVREFTRYKTLSDRYPKYDEDDAEEDDAEKDKKNTTILSTFRRYIEKDMKAIIVALEFRHDFQLAENTADHEIPNILEELAFLDRRWSPTRALREYRLLAKVGYDIMNMRDTVNTLVGKESEETVVNVQKFNRISNNTLDYWIGGRERKAALKKHRRAVDDSIIDHYKTELQAKLPRKMIHPRLKNIADRENYAKGCMKPGHYKPCVRNALQIAKRVNLDIPQDIRDGPIDNLIDWVNANTHNPPTQNRPMERSVRSRNQSKHAARARIPTASTQRAKSPGTQTRRRRRAIEDDDI